jgi:putative YphP/YqiW family bacilliredoxin
MYPEALITPIESELTDIGFIALRQGSEVTEHFTKNQGTTLLVINSLCGCAGPSARFSVTKALEEVVEKPDYLITVFAGIDQEAMSQIQDYIKPYPISSPSIALIKDGQVMHFIERHQIKGIDPELVAAELVDALKQTC